MTTSYSYIVKDNDLFGQDILRADLEGRALAFRPTIVHTNRQSPNKLNHNQTVESIVPQVRLVDGLAVSTDAFKATFKFSALQHIINASDANLAIDALLAYINTHRAVIIAGTKPLNNSTLVVNSAP